MIPEKQERIDKLWKLYIERRQCIFCEYSRPVDENTHNQPGQDYICDVFHRRIEMGNAKECEWFDERRV